MVSKMLGRVATRGVVAARVVRTRGVVAARGLVATRGVVAGHFHTLVNVALIVDEATRGLLVTRGLVVTCGVVAGFPDLVQTILHCCRLDLWLKSGFQFR